MKVWLRRLMLGQSGLPADLLTGLVGEDKDGRWSVDWVGAWWQRSGPHANDDAMLQWIIPLAPSA